MKKPDIKRLKYPLWFQIVFLILTVVIPASVAMAGGIQSSQPVFRFTFSVIISIVIVWVFVNHFIIKRAIDKLKERQVNLEHDYEIDNGNTDKIKYIWFTNEIMYTIFNVISLIVYGALIAAVIIGIKDGFIKPIRTICTVVIVSYIVAYVMKFITLLTMRKVEKEEGEGEDEKEQE